MMMLFFFFFLFPYFSFIFLFPLCSCFMAPDGIMFGFVPKQTEADRLSRCRASRLVQCILSQGRSRLDLYHHFVVIFIRCVTGFLRVKQPIIATSHKKEAVRSSKSNVNKNVSLENQFEKGPDKGSNVQTSLCMQAFDSIPCA